MIRLGISACLLGQPVRYDGQHKLDPYFRDTLGKFVEFVPVCPEVECGLPVPREAMHLVGTPGNSRLVTSATGRDITPMMTAWIEKELAVLAGENLCGFIFKAKSPSSGMERVKIYNEEGNVTAKTGRGLFAGAFMKRFPLLPVEDEGRLRDPDLRENFIERVFAAHRFRETVRKTRKASSLVEFHTAHKLLLMAHNEKIYRAMGRLVASAGRGDPGKTLDAYEGMLMEALKTPATPAKHANVLMHMLGYFRRIITPDEKQELLGVISGYRRGLVPLIVPVTLFGHFVRKHGVDYLKGQYYLDPHPLELKLRNHA